MKAKQFLVGTLLAAFALAPISASAAVSPVHYWSFDEAAGDAADSGSGNVTLSNGGLSYVAGQFGNALDCDGVSELAASGVNLANRSFSISFWLYLDSLPGGIEDFVNVGGVLMTNRALHFRVDGDGAVRFAFYGNDLDSGDDAVVAGRWQQVTLTYDVSTGSRRVYVDANVVAEDTSASAFIGNTTVMICTSAVGYPANGLIDDLRIYESALSLGQVRTLAGGNLAADLAADSGVSQPTVVVAERSAESSAEPERKREAKSSSARSRASAPAAEEDDADASADVPAATAPSATSPSAARGTTSPRSRRSSWPRATCRCPRASRSATSAASPAPRSRAGRPRTASRRPWATSAP